MNIPMSTQESGLKLLLEIAILYKVGSIGQQNMCCLNYLHVHTSNVERAKTFNLCVV